MQRKLIIIGLASNRIYKVIEFTQEDLPTNLMEFLRNKGIPIASSCLGQELCKKCIINNNLLSCSLTLEAFTQLSRPNSTYEIKVSYL